MRTHRDSVLIFARVHEREAVGPERLSEGRLSQRETQFASFEPTIFPVEKNFGEQSWKLANFVRQAKLLITKVSAYKCPRVP